ncbi:hypothetical protein [Escherichia coli]|uniref:hypothetical protein n=1 Tax=Escherichia coli TaxID=562 RepID=UPI003EE365CD
MEKKNRPLQAANSDIRVSFRDGVITDELSRTDIAMARRELSMLVEMGKQVMPRHCFGGA